MATTPIAVAPLAARTRFLFRVHRWTGILGGLPLIVILASGTLAVFKDEIDAALNPSLFRVATPETRIGLDEAIAAAGGKAGSIAYPEESGRPYLLYVTGPDGRLRQRFVDPSNGRVLGERPANGHFADVLRQIHVRFYFFGATGRIVVGAFGILLAISGITGLILYPRFQKGLGFGEIRWARGPQWRQADLHKLFGLTSIALNLLWAVTGAVLGLENLGAYWKPLRTAFHPAPTVQVEDSTRRVTLDRATALARQAIPGFEPRSVLLPSGKQSPLVVYGNTLGPWTAPSASWVSLHPGDGRVLQVHDERKARAVTQVYNWHDPLHFGTFAGIWSKLAWFGFGLAVTALPVTGMLVWWHKRRRGSGKMKLSADFAGDHAGVGVASGR